MYLLYKSSPWPSEYLAMHMHSAIKLPQLLHNHYLQNTWQKQDAMGQESSCRMPIGQVRKETVPKWRCTTSEPANVIG